MKGRAGLLVPVVSAITTGQDFEGDKGFFILINFPT
jgi:hypothetical protein